MSEPKQQNPPVPRSVKSWLSSDYLRQQIALVLPKHCTAERMVRVALTALMKTPKLAECTPESVMKCMLDLSALGLEPDGRRAHLIPYGTTCTLIVDYKGLVELCRLNGDATSIHADVVCDKDVFTYVNGEVSHLIDFRQDRGPMFATYVIVKFKDGSTHSEVMTRNEVDGIRKRSKAGSNGPWVTDFNEMAKKTVFRRASKWIKLSPEIQDALDSEGEVSATTLVSEVPQPQVRGRSRLPQFDGPSLVTSAEEPEDDLPMGEPGESAARAADRLEAKTIEIVQPTQIAKTESIYTEAEKLEAQRTAEKLGGTVTRPDILAANQLHTVQETLAEVVTRAGFTFDEWRKWADGVGAVQDATSLSSWTEVPNDVCKRLLRGKTMESVLKGMAEVKGKLL